MKKIFIALVLVLGLGVAGVASAGYWGGHMMGWGFGGYGPGPGYRATYGPCWTDGYGPAQFQQELTKDDAQTIADRYIGRNPNLKAGVIEEKGNYFETEIRTRDNSLVSKLTIDKKTGYVEQTY